MLRKTTADRIETLFELYEQKMYRIAFSILNDEGQAEDAVIAAFEKILKTEMAFHAILKVMHQIASLPLLFVQLRSTSTG